MTPDPKPIREWHDVTSEQFECEIRPLGQPAVLRGLERDWPLVRHGLSSAKDAADYLVGFYRGQPVSAITVPASERGRIFYNADMTGYNFSRTQEDLRNVLGALVRAAGAPDGRTIAMQAIPAQDALPGFTGEHAMALAPEIVPNLWIGSAAIVAPHYDLWENLACVAVGRRRFILFPPEQLPNLYVGPLDNTPAGAPVSMVPLVDPDLDRYPRYRAALAAAQTAELGPGDAIYIPYMWWHGVLALEPFNVLVNYWWNDAKSRSQVHPAMALVAARLAFLDLPEEQRRVWRDAFEHYVFGASEDALAHLPPHARGILGELDERQIAAAEQAIAGAFSGP
ncbi:MAG: cupin-like domain-containing protein [Sphingomicrobium sp.]